MHMADPQSISQLFIYTITRHSLCQYSVVHFIQRCKPDRTERHGSWGFWLYGAMVVATVLYHVIVIMTILMVCNVHERTKEYMKGLILPTASSH